MKPKAESKLLDVAIDGERGLERFKKLGRFVFASKRVSPREKAKQSKKVNDP